MTVPPVKRKRFQKRRRSLRSALASLRRADWPAWTATPKARIAIFSVAVLAVIVLVMAFIPSAEIILKPQPELQSVIIPITASADVTSVTLAGAVPLGEISVEVNGADSLVSSSTLLVPQNQARGVVRFENFAETAVSVPQGTSVSTAASPGIQFITTKNIKIPAGQSSDVAVQAVLPGSSGNLPAGSLTQPGGELAFRLSVTNPAPTSGGFDVRRPAPSSSDRERLQTQLSAALAGQALAQAAQQLGVDGHVMEVSGEPETLGAVFDPPEGLAGAQLKLELSQRFVVSYISDAEVRTLASQVLDASLPEGFAPAGALEVTLVGEPVRVADGALHWEVLAQRPMARLPDAGQVLALARGKTRSAALAGLANVLPVVAEIRLWPSWWPVLPVLPFRISVSW